MKLWEWKFNFLTKRNIKMIIWIVQGIRLILHFLRLLLLKETSDLLIKVSRMMEEGMGLKRKFIKIVIQEDTTKELGGNWRRKIMIVFFMMMIRNMINFGRYMVDIVFELYFMIF